MISLALLLAAAQPGALTGTWAGDRLVATVTEAGMTVQSDCAGGRIDSPLQVDRDGRFQATGRFAVGHGGPQRADKVEAQASARYEGQVVGDRMMLTVDDGKGAPRRFTLVRGAHLKLLRCL